MKKFLCLAALVAAMSLASEAQILINEVHGFGAGASPVLPGDYIELWNQSGTNVDLSGYTVGIWSGDTGTVASTVIPCTSDGRHILPANGFWILTEGTAQLGQAPTAALAGVRGMRGLPATWASSSNMGAYLLDPAGNCIDYVYLRRGTTALPATAPNLPPGCTWTLGNLGTTGTGNGHIHRLTNANTNSFADWAQNPSATGGTPGAENTTLGATQTPTGVVGAIVGIRIPWQINSPASSLDLNGVASPGTGPIAVQSDCTADLPVANFGSTNSALPFEVAVALGGTVSARDACGNPGTGGLNTANSQAFNLNVFDATLVFLNGLAFNNSFANFSVNLPANVALAAQAQMINIDPSNADGFALSAPIAYIATATVFPGTSTISLTRGDDVSVNVALSSLCGTSSINFFGTTYTNLFCISNGRALFGAAGDTDLSATLAEAQTDNPWVGFWTDLNPSAAASTDWSISNNGSLVTIAWNNIVYFGSTNAVSFSISFDTANDDVSITWTSILPNTGATGGGDAQMLGISGGAANGATQGASAAFATGVAGAGALPTDMLYEFWDGTAANAPGGINNLASFGTAGGVLFQWAGSQYSFLGL